MTTPRLMLASVYGCSRRILAGPRLWLITGSRINRHLSHTAWTQRALKGSNKDRRDKRVISPKRQHFDEGAFSSVLRIIEDHCLERIPKNTRLLEKYQTVTGTTSYDIIEFLPEYAALLRERLEKGRLRQDDIFDLNNYPVLPSGRFLLSRLDKAPKLGDSTEILDDAVVCNIVGILGHRERLGKSNAQLDDEGKKRSLVSVDVAKITNLSRPVEWYPAARALKRQWHLHVGPTNSGKTYGAIQRLKQAKTGVFAGPLRLLAREVYEKFQQQGIRCNLVTGEEVVNDIDEFGNAAGISSSTVEMVNLNRRMEVCVLDEIQMIGDQFRGWAWTQALLGIQADEIHMCGEASVVGLIEKLAGMTGDSLVVHQYERLSPLEVAESSLKNDWSKLEKGDCVVAFSRAKIFALKRAIESMTNVKCGVIYGGLPPEVRASQAQGFNDPNGIYDVLLATDAIGMGLNLSIRRVILSEIFKFDGESVKSVPIPQVKQIAGRAGRYNVMGVAVNETQEETNRRQEINSHGYALTFKEQDMQFLRYCLRHKTIPLTKAGILPPTNVLADFMTFYSPQVKLNDILIDINRETQLGGGKFFLCGIKQQMEIAQDLSSINLIGLTSEEKVNMMMAPTPKSDTARDQVKFMALCLSNNQPITIADIPNINLNMLLNESIIHEPTLDILKQLELLHKTIIMYIWLSYRFENIFTKRDSANELKTLCEYFITRIISCLDFSNEIEIQREKTRQRRRSVRQNKKQKLSTTTPQVHHHHQHDDMQIPATFTPS